MREQRGLRFRWLPLDGGTQQPTKSRPKRWDIVGGDGAQDNHDEGGRCSIVSAVEFGGKKKIKQNSSWLKAAANRRLNTTTNQINAGAAGEGYATGGERRGSCI